MKMVHAENTPRFTMKNANENVVQLFRTYVTIQWNEQGSLLEVY